MCCVDSFGSEGWRLKCRTLGCFLHTLSVEGMCCNVTGEVEPVQQPQSTYACSDLLPPSFETPTAQVFQALKLHKPHQCAMGTAAHLRVVFRFRLFVLRGVQHRPPWTGLANK